MQKLLATNWQKWGVWLLSFVGAAVNVVSFVELTQKHASWLTTLLPVLVGMAAWVGCAYVVLSRKTVGVQLVGISP